ncbi:MAG: hypothetical protein N838_33295 [Thiohalocapsa sp. PB-PSB1]|jgi:hypothetical protein|nr:MAG: hypothetical protein N838_28225 [Thiohalocapsa sp. PB-PSB1]QQO57505.1 MAG: hypothetical protein N838_33295 [Thiohalocapsa sp. PB-PSB1]
MNKDQQFKSALEEIMASLEQDLRTLEERASIGESLLAAEDEASLLYQLLERHKALAEKWGQTMPPFPPRSVEIRPTPSCMANHLTLFVPSHSPVLKIKWNENDKYFNVDFRAKGDIPFDVRQVLTQKIPLVIAEESRCTCGHRLKLGEYEVTVKQKEYVLVAEYYCEDCKAKRHIEEARLTSRIKKFFGRLRKIQVSPKGVVLETK